MFKNVHWHDSAGHTGRYCSNCAVTVYVLDETEALINQHQDKVPVLNSIEVRLGCLE